MTGPRPSSPDLTVLDTGAGVRVPVSEIVLTAITGGGPGGQHVNRNATRIALTWNVRTSAALTEEQRARVLDKLASRLDGDGTLRIVAGEYRSQQQNRRAALDRLRLLLSRALVVQRPRKATRPTRGSVEARLSGKKQRSEVKQQRRRDIHD